MMNTTDKTLLGLSCHAKSKCIECPYEDQPECSSKLAADAEKMLNGAIDDIDDMKAGNMCKACKFVRVHINKEPCCSCMHCNYARKSAFEWRGVEVKPDE